MLKMEPFMAVLEDLECKIFFVTQPWWSTFLRSRKEVTGGGKERRRKGKEGEGGPTEYEKIISYPGNVFNVSDKPEKYQSL